MRKEICAFYTPEAALVMLISLLAIFSLIILAFRLHDTQSVQAELNRLMDRAEAEGWEEEKLLGEAERLLLSGDLRLFFLNVEEVKIQREDGEMTLSAETREKAIRSTYSPHEPEEFMRKSEAIKGIIE